MPWFARTLCALVICSFASACGSAAKPVLQLNEAEKNIERARAVDAEQTPQAALHLKLARDQVKQAKRYILDDENDLARHMLRRAASDAELAEALARKAEAEEELENTRYKIDRLRK